MNVAIAILNWNGKALLQEYLPAVLAHSAEATTYVIDNGSNDDSVAYLESTFPAVRVIELAENHGFAEGYNLGIQQIEEELVVIMNNDLRPGPNWLGPLVEAFEQDHNLFAAQPKILDHHQEDRFEYAGAAGGYIDRLGYPFCRGRIFDTLEFDQGQYDDPISIFWASGACLAVRRDRFVEAGGFDGDLFAHQEEIDLCWRLKRMKGSIWCFPASRVYHLGGGTLDKMNPRKTYLNFRNSLLLLVKHVSLTSLWWILLLRLVLDGIALLRFLIKGQFRHGIAVVEAWIGLFRFWGRFFRKRNRRLKPIKYWKLTAIVWSYYLLKKRTFNQL